MVLLIGSALLLATSLVSLYWSAVAVEASLHGFNWLILAVTSFCAFAVGALGGVMSLRRKNEALVIFAVCVPLIVNLSMVSYALSAYSLAVPWMFIFASTIASIASGLLIAHFDDQFTK
jgi:CHASE2 domain-containing sensor protein